MSAQIIQFPQSAIIRSLPKRNNQMSPSVREEIAAILAEAPVPVNPTFSLEIEMEKLAQMVANRAIEIRKEMDGQNELDRLAAVIAKRVRPGARKNPKR